MRIYFDNAATTPVHPEVVKEMTHIYSNVYGNPSSIHEAGRKARTIVENARKTVANYLNCSVGEVFFTSSATEANNTIIRKAVSDLGVKNIIVSSIEHPCVMNTALELANSGNVSLKIIEVDHCGIINFEQLEQTLAQLKEKSLVSIMHVNNEIGTMQDLNRIATLCKENDALFHSDAVQAIGKLPFDLQELPIDFLSGTAHKFHGPKGTGFMYIKNDYTISSFITGGGQERNMRSGTENVAGIAGLAKAIEIYISEQGKRMDKIAEVKSYFKTKLKEALPEIWYLEDQGACASIPNILSVSFPSGPKTDLMTFNLDIEGISASAGSACSSGVEKTSHVLSAIKFPEDRRAVRFSFSYFNTFEEVDMAIQKIKKILS